METQLVHEPILVNSIPCLNSIHNIDHEQHNVKPCKSVFGVSIVQKGNALQQCSNPAPVNLPLDLHMDPPRAANWHIARVRMHAILCRRPTWKRSGDDGQHKATTVSDPQAGAMEIFTNVSLGVPIGPVGTVGDADARIGRRGALDGWEFEKRGRRENPVLRLAMMLLLLHGESTNKRVPRLTEMCFPRCTGSAGTKRRPSHQRRKWAKSQKHRRRPPVNHGDTRRLRVPDTQDQLRQLQRHRNDRERRSIAVNYCMVPPN